jgi:SAM-dependent methyltransferase
MLDDQLRIIQPGANRRILEIGPGNGRLTIPLARSSSEITVVDPSPRMLTSLGVKMRTEGLSNVRFVNDHWERLCVGNLGRFHKLVSSYSLFMKDIKVQLERMNSISDEVYLFVPAEQRIPPEVQEILFDDVVLKHTDHEILTNLAAELDYDPKSFIIEYPNWIGFDNEEKALDHFSEFFDIQEVRRERFANYLRSILVFTEGQYFISSSRKVGVICWRND